MDLPIEKSIEIPRKWKFYGAVLILVVAACLMIFGYHSWQDWNAIRTLEKEKRQLEKVAYNAQTELKNINAQKTVANANLANLEKKEVKTNETHRQTQTNTNVALNNFNTVRRNQRTDNPTAAQLCEELKREHQLCQ